MMVMMSTSFVDAKTSLTFAMLIVVLLLHPITKNSNSLVQEYNLLAAFIIYLLGFFSTIMHCLEERIWKVKKGNS